MRQSTVGYRVTNGRGAGSAIRLFVAVVAFGMIAASCASDSPSSDDDGTQSSVTAGTVVSTGSADAGDWVAQPLSVLCSGSYVVPGLDVDAAVGIPAPDGIADGPELGVDGAAAVVRMLGPDVPHLCTLDVSPAVAAAIAEIDKAGAAGDADEVSRLLDELISHDIGAWAPVPLGVSAHDGTDHEQEARDWIETGEAAERNGDDDAAHDAYGEAAAEYSQYVNETMGNTSDAQKLMEMAETSAFLGNNEDADALLAKILEIREKELAPIADAYDPCTADAKQTGVLVDAAARVLILGGNADLAMEKILERMDIYERRGRGDPVPECDSLGFQESNPIPVGDGWDGEEIIDLVTCDGVTWTGTLSGEGVLDTGGGRMSFNYTTPVSITLPDASGEEKAEIQIPLSIGIQAAEATGTVSATADATVTLKVDASALTASVTVDRQSTSGTIKLKAKGISASMPFNMAGSSTTMNGPITRNPSCG